MLFNSYDFIFYFLPIVFLGYFLLNNLGQRFIAKCFLVVSSLFFYGWWNILYVPLIVGSMLFNYMLGVRLCQSSKSINKKFILVFGICANICLLGYFKYTDFLIGIFNTVLEKDMVLLNLTLPLAISFFTFQQIAYLVDSYKQQTKEYSLLNYSIFVTFFPQLIAGPIVHHKEMMPQFENIQNRRVNHRNISIGLLFFSIGLFKKVVIADTFSKWVSAGFDNPENIMFIEAWFTSLSYTFQLYFDFSGYADMAIGIALFFNIKLPPNFNSPYKAINIQEFWRRWHITLSRFLRDYIYIPLGGSKSAHYKIYLNVLITFIIGGIWHGAGFTFIVWGMLHGAAMVMYRAWCILGLKMNKILAWFVTFNFVNFAWVFFRADNIDDALMIIKGMLFFNGIMLPDFVELKSSPIFVENVFYGSFLQNIQGVKQAVVWLFLAFLISVFSPNSNEISQKFKANKKWMCITLFLFLSAILFMNQPTEFLYFNF